MRSGCQAPWDPAGGRAPPCAAPPHFAPSLRGRLGRALRRAGWGISSGAPRAGRLDSRFRGAGPWGVGDGGKAPPPAPGLGWGALARACHWLRDLGLQPGPGSGDSRLCPARGRAERRGRGPGGRGHSPRAPAGQQQQQQQRRQKAEEHGPGHGAAGDRACGGRARDTAGRLGGGRAHPGASLRPRALPPSRRPGPLRGGGRGRRSRRGPEGSLGALLETHFPLALAETGPHPLGQESCRGGDGKCGMEGGYASEGKEGALVGREE